MRIFWPKSLHDVRSGDFGFFIATRIPRGLDDLELTAYIEINMEENRIYETPELSLCDTAIERGFAASMDTSTEEITPGEEVDW